jgi:hypothetical protein
MLIPASSSSSFCDRTSDRVCSSYTNINETVPVHEEVLSAEESTSASVGNMCYHMLNLSGK